MMGPTRKSRSMNKRYSYINEVSGDSAIRSNSRKMKLTDMLGPQWSKEELSRFYEAYRKHGKDWKKLAGAVRNRSADMVEALYMMNRAYLSLPEGTASAVGLIAMMTDHYSNLAGSESEQESNDGGAAGSSRKSQKRARGGRVQPATATSKGFDGQLLLSRSNYDCMSSLLKKKRSGGSRPRPVGKRTPRFPVSFSYDDENVRTRQGLKINANANDDEVAHEIALALAEASRGGSPQVSRTPSRRAESVMSSPFRHAQTKPSMTGLVDTKLSPANIYEEEEEDFEESAEADTGDFEEQPVGVAEANRHKGKKHQGKKKLEDDNNHLDDIKEECSGTEEGPRLGSTRDKFEVDVKNSRNSRFPTQTQRKKTKKVLFAKDDESPTFDALQTLADLSLMMPTDHEDESRVQFKDEDTEDHVDESEVVPAKQQQRDRRRSAGMRMKGGYHRPMSSFEIAASNNNNKRSKLHGKVSVFLDDDDSCLLLEDPQESLSKTVRRKKQKVEAASLSQIQKTEAAQPDVKISQAPPVEDGDAGKKSTSSKSKKSSQSGSPELLKISESDSAQSAVEPPLSIMVNLHLPTKKVVRSRRKMDRRRKPIEKLSNNDENNSTTKLTNCLSNDGVRRWCTYEWFYSGIDYPWFGKREFVEYLYHVGLGHVPRLTRIEWGVIRSSLGKPRRFSEQFLKEEKEKLNQYRDSVRKHYTELREGIREGVPKDLAKPLSVGQRVTAIHPKTREIHDGKVLTVDHSRCRVQFDRHDLGVEFVMDIDCMPLNPFENMPALLGKQISSSVDKLFENFNELRMKEYMKTTPGDNINGGLSHLSPSAHPPSKLLKVASANTNLQQHRTAAPETVTYQRTAAYPLHPSSVAAKEADVQALAELTRALEKKEAIVEELRHMNDDVLENHKDNNGDSTLKDSEPFKKQYAAVLVQLNEANDQVSTALLFLRQRNTYQGEVVPNKPITNIGDHSARQPHESSVSHVYEIIDRSRINARTMVDAAMQAISSLNTIEKIEEAIDYVNDHLPLDDHVPVVADTKFSSSPNRNEAQVPSQLITHCVATLLMIQKCTERQFPPADVAQILDSAVACLQPCSARNLPVYAEIQKCMGIIRNQILALIPT